MNFILPLLIGTLAGTSSGLFGIGGGVIIVPMVALLYKLPQQGAVATSLIALLLPVGSLGVWQYYSQGYISSLHVKTGLLIAAGMLIGTFGGAKIATFLSGETLTKMFAVFLVIVAVRLWWMASS